MGPGARGDAGGICNSRTETTWSGLALGRQRLPLAPQELWFLFRLFKNHPTFWLLGYLLGAAAIWRQTCPAGTSKPAGSRPAIIPHRQLGLCVNPYQPFGVRDVNSVSK